MKPRSLLLLAVALLLSRSAFADNDTWNANTGSDDWSVPSNWLSGVGFPGAAAGDVANLTYALTIAETVTIDSGVGSGITLGILNIGDSGGLHSYTLNSTGPTLTFNNNGSGAQINQVATSAGDLIDLPLILADNLTITNLSVNQFTLGNGNDNASISGPGNVTLAADATPTSGNAIQFGNGANIDNTGAFTNAGTASNNVRLQGGIGSNVTTIIQSSAVSTLTVASPISVNPAGTTFINSGGAGLSAEQGIGGTGNVTLENDASNGTDINLGNATGLVGSIFLTGTGTAITQVGPLGAGVSQVIQQSATVEADLRNGTATIDPSGLVLTDTGGALLRFLQSTSGTGDMILHNNSSVNAALEVQEQTLNHVGQVINSGTGTGESYITSALGGSLTGVVQNSASSALEFRSNGTTFVGTVTIQAGTLILSGNNPFSAAAEILVGDTAADGPGSFFNSNLDSQVLTLGSGQILAGFGTINGRGNVEAGTGSHVAPGNGAIGTLTIGNNLVVDAGSNLDFTLGAPGTNDSIAVGSQLTLVNTNTYILNLIDNAGANGQGSLGAGSYDLISYSSLAGGATAGDISGLFTINGPAGFTYSVSDTGVGTGNIVLTVATAAVPEPASWATLLGGLGLLLGFGKIRRRGS